MGSAEREEEHLRWSYRQALRADPSTGKSVRNFCALAILIITLLIPIEYYLFPNRFYVFLAMRLTTNAALAYVYVFGSRSYPIASTQAVQLTIASMVVAMITLDSAGVASQYASGLIFGFCAFPILAPLSVWQVAVSIVPTLAAFLVVPQILHPVDMKTYWLHAIFPIVGAIAGLGSASVLDAVRFSEFTKRKELEQARDELKALDAAKSRFTANVHHELRTPLTLVLSPLEAILAGAMGPVPPAIGEMLESMRSNGLRLLKLINNLLDLSRIESQKMKIRRRSIDVGRVAEDIVRGALGMAARKAITLSAQVESGLPRINVDPDALDKILVNLVGNALKFTESEGSIDVSVRQRESGIYLVVSDTGIGIPRDQLSRVFDRFAQVDMTEGKRYEGTGIGLSLVRELIVLHRGKVWAESPGPGQGTQIHVTLPVGEPDFSKPELVLEDAGLRDAALDRAFTAVEAETSGRTDSRGWTEVDGDVRRWELNQPTSLGDPDSDDPSDERAEVLIVEDNGDMRALLRALLSTEFRVRLARNGLEGLQSVRDRLPDVVLSDVMMPGMTGLELTTAIKELPETASVPVILVTSKAEREMRAEGLERGADDYVTKPFHPRELIARVRTSARLRRLQQDLERKNQSLADALDQLRLAQAQLVHREKMSALGHLVAGVAHEINNPVSFIQGNLQFLEEYVSTLLMTLRAYEESAASIPDLPGRIQDVRATGAVVVARDDIESVLHGIREGVERTIAIVQDLRTFSRLDRAEVLRVEPTECLDSTLNLLSGRLHGVEVIREYGATPAISCLAGHLSQVFMNLLTNAADAVSEDGRIVIRTGVSGSDRVFIEVEDNGSGISPDLLDKIFDPFFTTKEIGKGTGLGLSISHGIIERHGGSISIRSEPGKGTSVRVELPIEFDPDLAERTPES